MSLLPMWGLWLKDPSGKYGPHKAFYELGATVEDAQRTAIARYKVDGVSVDESRPPFLASAGMSVEESLPPFLASAGVKAAAQPL